MSSSDDELENRQPAPQSMTTGHRLPIFRIIESHSSGGAGPGLLNLERAEQERERERKAVVALLAAAAARPSRPNMPGPFDASHGSAFAYYGGLPMPGYLGSAPSELPLNAATYYY